MRGNAIILAASVFVGIAGCFNSEFRAHAQQAPAEAVRETNMSTVGIAAGRIEGAPLRFAAELARVVDDGTSMRLLPIVTRGPFENIKDLLFLRGVDMAIVNGDVLDHYKKHRPHPEFESRINYIMHLFPSELHIFVRPEINSLADLNGKPVNFNTEGTAAAYTGPIILERLGIKVDARFDPHPTAMREMAAGDKYAATVWVSTKPLDPFLRRQWPKGFKFLPVPLTDKLEDYYLPAELSHADYPQLIPAGQSITTVSVPAVLAVYAWQPETDRYRRVERFIDYLIERFPRLQNEAGFHPRWKDINIAAAVPGWRRFPAMQSRLDELSGGVHRRASSMETPLSSAAPARLPGGGDGTSESDARQIAAAAGYHVVGPLTLDRRNIWIGTAMSGNDRIRIAIDQNGVLYRRGSPSIMKRMERNARP